MQDAFVTALRSKLAASQAHANARRLLTLINHKEIDKNGLDTVLLSDEDYITGEDGTLRMYVNIIGHVKYPGTYLVYDGIDLLTCLSLAGGPLKGAKLSKVSIIGVGMITTPGITYRMFQALASKKINILVISTSEIKISVLVSSKNVKKAIAVLHKEFKLD